MHIQNGLVRERHDDVMLWRGIEAKRCQVIREPLPPASNNTLGIKSTLQANLSTVPLLYHAAERQTGEKDQHF
jgi:hypothetical protein